MSEFAFTPTKEQIENSNVHRLAKKLGFDSFEKLLQKSYDDPEWFWEQVSSDIGIVWSKKFEKILDISDGIAWPKWFVGGKTNIVTSSLERFAKETPNKIAYHFVSEDGTVEKITYSQLEIEVTKLANGLQNVGVKKGDVIAIYLPMIKEAFVAVLAAAKIGAIQTIIFSGFSADSLNIRLQDSKAKVLFVCDGFFRRGKKVSQKKTVVDAIKNTVVEKIFVVPYKGIDNFSDVKNSIPYYEIANDVSDFPSLQMDSEDPLFILYTSGTTGRPKGVVHVHGGFSVFAGHQSSYLIDMNSDDVLFWPADIGWITGLVWNLYGLLLIGGTAVIYDGALDYPDFNRVWDILHNYGVTIFGISPTAVRLFKKNNIMPLEIHSYKIKNIPTTGEPIDEESWWWLFEKVGNKKIPIMNLSGGTEIGGAMLSVFPGMRIKPTSVGIPVLGMNLDVFDDEGKSITDDKGYLVVKSPWPAMSRGLLNDPKRFIETYWSRFENSWFHGDYVLKDKDGLWYMHGRLDDVINVSGHRLSTAEVEQTVISHDLVSEAAAISIPDEITGEAIVVFVVPLSEKNIEKIISDHVTEKIGKIARPKLVFVVSDLPKTRTGKIMRRLIKSKLLGLPLGDLSSLENQSSLDDITCI